MEYQCSERFLCNNRKNRAIKTFLSGYHHSFKQGKIVWEANTVYRGVIMLSRSCSKSVMADSIIETVGKYYGISVLDIMSQKRRPKEIVVSRHVAMYLIRKILSLPILDIAALFSRHHTIVLHSLRMMEEELQTNASLCRAVDDLRKIIRDWANHTPKHRL